MTDAEFFTINPRNGRRSVRQIPGGPLLLRSPLHRLANDHSFLVTFLTPVVNRREDDADTAQNRVLGASYVTLTKCEFAALPRFGLRGKSYRQEFPAIISGEGPDTFLLRERMGWS